jgi:hypothetical protein
MRIRILNKLLEQSWIWSAAESLQPKWTFESAELETVGSNDCIRKKCFQNHPHICVNIVSSIPAFLSLKIMNNKSTKMYTLYFLYNLQASMANWRVRLKFSWKYWISLKYVAQCIIDQSPQNYFWVKVQKNKINLKNGGWNWCDKKDAVTFPGI